MFSLRRQILLLLGVTLGSLLAAKTLVDFSRARPAVENAARARGQLALLQARALLEHSATDGSTGSLRRLLSPLAASPGVEQLALLRPDGTVLFSSHPELEQRFASGTSLAPLLRLNLTSGELQVSGDALLGASPVRLSAPAPPPPTDASAPPAPAAAVRPMALVLQLDLAGPLGAGRLAAALENGFTLVVVVLVLALIGWLLEARIGRPVRRIVSAIEQFDGGERGARTGLRGPDEIGGLARAFDAMAERMQTAEVLLLDTQTALDGLLRALPIGVLVVKRDDGRPYYVNSRWRELFGIHLEAHRDILAILSTVRCERPDGSPYPIEQQPITVVLRTGAPAEARDLCVRHDDRVVRLVAHAVPVSLTHAGSFEAVLVIAREAEATEAATQTWTLAPEPQRTIAAAAAEPPAQADGDPALDDPTLPTVMLVDADRTTCVQAAGALRAAGYRVLVAEDGARALSLLRNEAPRIEVIVLDLAIAGPGGGTVLDDLLRFDPAARVIAASGYRPDLPDLAASGKVTAFMTRPYGPDRVVRAVREAIGAAAELERAFAP